MIKAYNTTMEKAVYTKTKSLHYKNNPFYEAIPTMEILIGRIAELTKRITITDKERAMEPEERLALLADLESFTILTQRHIDLIRKAHRMLREGYLKRNPQTIEFHVEVNERAEMRDAGEADNLFSQGCSYADGTAKMMTIFGLPGMGKTTAAELFLKLFPLYISHSKYNGKPIILTQIPCIRIKCPSDASLHTLCFDFFDVVDRIAKTNYRAKFGYSSKDVSKIINQMRIIGATYGIGLLIIDELQDLVDSGKDTSEVTTFISQLANKVGFPVIFVGTVSSYDLIRTSSALRRMTTGGEIAWDRMMYGDTDWNTLLQELWEMQVVKYYSELTPAMNDLLYHYSQGITDYLKRLIFEAQVIAIESGHERLSLEMVREAEKNMRSIMGMTEAIRDNNLQILARAHDTVMRNPFIKDSTKSAEHSKKIATYNNLKMNTEDRMNKMILQEKKFLVESKLSEELNAKKIEEIVHTNVLNNRNLNQQEIRSLIIDEVENEIRKQEKRKNKALRIRPVSSGLIAVAEKGSEYGSIYDALRNEGYIGSIE